MPPRGQTARSPARGAADESKGGLTIVPRVRNLVLSRSLVVLDTETTGLDARRDRLIEIAAIKYAPKRRPKVFHRRLHPGVSIPPQASAVHGITDADVVECPRFDSVAPRLMRFLVDADLAGYNVTFDLQFLLAEFGRCGLDLPLDGRAVIDPMRIFHEREPRDLAAAVEFYCGCLHLGTHSALADAAAAAVVLDEQLARYEDLPRLPADLHRYLVPVDVAGRFRVKEGVIVFGFGKHLGKRLDEVVCDDPGYLDWMLAQDFLPDTKAVVRAALDRPLISRG